MVIWIIWEIHKTKEDSKEWEYREDKIIISKVWWKEYEFGAKYECK